MLDRMPKVPLTREFAERRSTVGVGHDDALTRYRLAAKTTDAGDRVGLSVSVVISHLIIDPQPAVSNGG
jgi:hypothetical protein